MYTFMCPFITVYENKKQSEQLYEHPGVMQIIKEITLIWLGHLEIESTEEGNTVKEILLACQEIKEKLEDTERGGFRMWGKT